MQIMNNTNSNKVSILSLSYILFCLFLLVKPFYFLESGSFQLGDLFMALSAGTMGIWYLFAGRKTKRFWECFWKGDILFVIFIAFVLLINSIYYTKLHETYFLAAALFYVYNLAAILVFRYFAQNDRMLNGIKLVLRCNVYIQVLMFITGIGAYRFEHRWCGTFNDPNQMGFFILMCLLLSFSISEMQGKHRKSEWLDWLCGVLLVVLSKSVGITLGFGVFGVLFFVYALYKKFQQLQGDDAESQRKRKRLVLTLCTGGFVVVVLVTTVVLVQLKAGDEYNIYVRLVEKVRLLLDGNKKEILAERGLDNILAKPAALIYGTGEGVMSRFRTNYSGKELHCTPAAILFYYGMIPFGILCAWIWANIKKLPRIAYIVYIALFFESLFLANQRQPLFWMGIVLGMIWREYAKRRRVSLEEIAVDDRDVKEAQVQIFMSTYNGEKYLREQLESIALQSCQNWKLRVRDDGSSDGTINILKEYADKYPDKISYYTGDNMGACSSFLELAKEADSTCGYYAFCDQDDVWKKDKLERALRKLLCAERQNAGDMPVLYCSALDVVNEKLELINKKDLSSKKDRMGFGNALVENVCTGCTMMVNKSAVNGLRNLPEGVGNKILMHDWWMYLYASCFGVVVYDSYAGISYRQHQNNVVGETVNVFEKIRMKVRAFWGNRGRLRGQMQAFRMAYGEQIPKEKAKLINDCLGTEKNIVKRIAAAGGGMVYRLEDMDDFVCKVQMLMGLL